MASAADALTHPWHRAARVAKKPVLAADVLYRTGSLKEIWVGMCVQYGKAEEFYPCKLSEHDWKRSLVACLNSDVSLAVSRS